MRGECRDVFLSRVLVGLLALTLSAGLAAPAGAEQFGFFDAHVGVFMPDVGFGVAEDATAAEAFGVEIVPNVLLGEAARTARLFEFASFGGALEISFGPLTVEDGNGFVTVTYTGVTLIGAPEQEAGEEVYLFFATSEIGGPYASSDVGIDVDDILLQTAASELELYYPAVRLPNGGNLDTFSIDLQVLGGFEMNEGGAPIVPDLVVGGAYVVPEPATAGLMGLGLLGLTVLSGRRYSA